jgi:2-dehydropantoate 2-reductase
MRIAVMGAGGIGANYGARLAHAGNEVSLIARGKHMVAMRDHGVTIESNVGETLHIHPALVTDTPADVGPVDVVLFTTKLYDIETAAHACRPLLGPQTMVISLCNGVDGPRVLADVLGDHHVAGGVAYTTANITSPGVIRHVSGAHAIGFGELDSTRSPVLESFSHLATQAGIEVTYTPRIDDLLWGKFVLNIAGAGATALSRQPLGVVREDLELSALYDASMNEVITIAKALGINTEGFAERGKQFLAQSSSASKPSLLLDLERGNRLEVDWLAGTIVRLGRELNVSTPVNWCVWCALRPFIHGRVPAT